MGFLAGGASAALMMSLMMSLVNYDITDDVIDDVINDGIYDITDDVINDDITIAHWGFVCVYERITYDIICSHRSSGLIKPSPNSKIRSMPRVLFTTPESFSPIARDVA